MQAQFDDDSFEADDDPDEEWLGGVQAAGLPIRRPTVATPDPRVASPARLAAIGFCQQLAPAGGPPTTRSSPPP